MTITVLAENTACRADVLAQHGLCLYIETEGRKILVDMGQDDTFARNAQILGIDLSQVELAVLSHGHYDHGGGLETFFEINQKSSVYVQETAFGRYYNGTQKYIGLNTAIQKHPRLRFVKGRCDLTPGIRLSDCNALDWHSNSWGLNRKEGDRFIPDRFFHEQYLEIKEGEKRILISGCSHKGIVNIAQHFHPHALIGGFHLNKETDEERLRAIGEALLANNTMYYTGHCTGSLQFAVLKDVMGSRLESLSTGMVLEV